MHRRTRIMPGLMMAAAVFALTGCDVESEPAEDATLDTTWQDTAAQQDQMGASQEMYEANLEEANGSGVTGAATITVENEELRVTVAATGVEPNTRVPQHIHVNATCDEAGGILLNLDDDLSAPNDGDPRGDAYPETDDQGSLRFEGTRSIAELRTAIGEEDADTAGQADTARQPDTANVGARSGADSFDFGNRVVKLHGPDMQSIACGPLDPMSQGQ